MREATRQLGKAKDKQRLPLQECRRDPPPNLFQRGNNGDNFLTSLRCEKILSVVSIEFGRDAVLRVRIGFGFRTRGSASLPLNFLTASPFKGGMARDNPLTPFKGGMARL